MKKKLLIGAAAAAVTGALAYWYRRSHNRKQITTPETSRVRLRGETLSHVKPARGPVE